MSPKTHDPKSAFSPWSSSPVMSSLLGSQPSPYRSSQQMTEAPAYTGDMEMADSSFPQSGSLQTEDLKGATGRIPTPINAQFSHTRAHLPSLGRHLGYLGQESDRRLPSPISEDDRSPSIMLEGIGGMQVDEDAVEEKLTPRKGHTRSKHNLREWSGYAHEPGGIKKFSMGYKSDCEKCRLRIPGHFSHVVTYPNDYDWTKDE